MRLPIARRLLKFGILGAVPVFVLMGLFSVGCTGERQVVVQTVVVETEVVVEKQVVVDREVTRVVQVLVYGDADACESCRDCCSNGNSGD